MISTAVLFFVWTGHDSPPESMPDMASCLSAQAEILQAARQCNCSAEAPTFRVRCEPEHPELVS